MLSLFKSGLCNIAQNWNEFWFAEISAYPIAAYRILLGIYLILYMAASAPNVALSYSNEGVYSPFLIPDIAPSIWLAWILYVLTLLLAAAFTVGYRTRYSTPALLILFLYHFFLNIAVKACSYDRLLLMSLTLMSFGEIDGAWSISALQKQKTASIEKASKQKKLSEAKLKEDSGAKIAGELQEANEPKEEDKPEEAEAKEISKPEEANEAKEANDLREGLGEPRRVCELDEINDPKVSAWLTRILALHLSIFYFLTGLFKVLSPGWHTGEVLRGVMSSVYASSAGFTLLSLKPPSELFDLMAVLVILFELSCPFFFFVRRLELNILVGATLFSLKLEHVQYWFFLCGFFFHSGIWLVMQLPQFMICPAGYVLYLNGDQVRNLFAQSWLRLRWLLIRTELWYERIPAINDQPPRTLPE